MKSGDLVYLTAGDMPTVGQVVAFTPKRVRVAVKSGQAYITVLRKNTNLILAKKSKPLI